jgi:transposase
LRRIADGLRNVIQKALHAAATPPVIRASRSTISAIESASAVASAALVESAPAVASAALVESAPAVASAALVESTPAVASAALVESAPAVASVPVYSATVTSCASEANPEAASVGAPRWTLKRLVAWVETTFGRTFCRETIRKALKRLGLSWKKAKKLLSRADPVKRRAFVERIQVLLHEAMTSDDDLLVYIDEAHIHQDVDLGYGWSERGRRFWVCSSTPGLSEKVSFYGLYLYNEAQVRIWPYPRANGDNTIEVLQRLRAQFPTRTLKLLWDGASYHRSDIVRQAADSLGIELIPLPGYSPDFMPVEALWRWFREEVTYNHCHVTRSDLIDRAAAFEKTINLDPYTLADRLWVKDEIDPAEEKLRMSK